MEYSKEVLEGLEIADCKPVCTLLDRTMHNMNLGDRFVSKKLYREGIESLMYLMIYRRPDL